MIAAPHERLGDWWDNTHLAQARQEAEAAGGPPADDWDPERMFLHDVPPDVAAASADHVTEQSDRPSQDVWPLDAWPDVPIRVVIGRDDRLFPLAFQRRLVQERLGIVPDELPGGHLPALARPDELVELPAVVTHPRVQAGTGPPRSDASNLGWAVPVHERTTN